MIIPANFQELAPFVARDLNAPTVSRREILPIAISAKNMLRPTAKAKNRYIRINAEPPLLPTMYGNFHALPRPIAAPIIDKIKPILLNLSAIIYLPSGRSLSHKWQLARHILRKSTKFQKMLFP